MYGEYCMHHHQTLTLSVIRYLQEENTNKRKIKITANKYRSCFRSKHKDCYILPVHTQLNNYVLSMDAHVGKANYYSTVTCSFFMLYYEFFTN